MAAFSTSTSDMSGLSCWLKPHGGCCFLKKVLAGWRLMPIVSGELKLVQSAFSTAFKRRLNVDWSNEGQKRQQPNNPDPGLGADALTYRAGVEPVALLKATHKMVDIKAFARLGRSSPQVFRIQLSLFRHHVQEPRRTVVARINVVWVALHRRVFDHAL